MYGIKRLGFVQTSINAISKLFTPLINVYEHVKNKAIDYFYYTEIFPVISNEKNLYLCNFI